MLSSCMRRRATATRGSNSPGVPGMARSLAETARCTIRDLALFYLYLSGYRGLSNRDHLLRYRQWHFLAVLLLTPPHGRVEVCAASSDQSLRSSHEEFNIPPDTT